MNNITTIKTYILTAAGIVGGIVTNLFGGWDYVIQTLILFMVIDYITGFLNAAYFHKSLKSEHGRLDSSVGFKGICRKGVILLIVLIGVRLDLILDTHFVRDAVIIGFIVNEGISITENAVLMGIPIPKPIKDALDALKNKKD